MKDSQFILNMFMYTRKTTIERKNNHKNVLICEVVKKES